jgi:hypothetical protein
MARILSLDGGGSWALIQVWVAKTSSTIEIIDPPDSSVRFGGPCLA